MKQQNHDNQDQDKDKVNTSKKRDMVLGSSVTGPVNDLKGPALVVQGISGKISLRSKDKQQRKTNTSGEK